MCDSISRPWKHSGDLTILPWGPAAFSWAIFFPSFVTLLFFPTFFNETSGKSGAFLARCKRVERKNTKAEEKIQRPCHFRAFRGNDLSTGTLVRRLDDTIDFPPRIHRGPLVFRLGNFCIKKRTFARWREISQRAPEDANFFFLQALRLFASDFWCGIIKSSFPLLSRRFLVIFRMRVIHWCVYSETQRKLYGPESTLAFFCR